MDLRDVVLPGYAQMLRALSGQLDKARGQLDGEGKPADGLLDARLAPDMLPLAAQVQFVCLQAEEARARLLNEAINAPDAPPATMAEAQAMLARAIERLEADGADHPSAGDPSGNEDTDETRMIELKIRGDMIFDLDLAEYVRSWALPQFYFHTVTAYAIMRKEGIALGKADYVPHMFGFLRGGAA